MRHMKALSILAYFRNYKATTPPKRGRTGEPRLAGKGDEFQIPCRFLICFFSPALFVSKRIFEKVVVSLMKVILKAKDLKAIVSTDDPKL